MVVATGGRAEFGRIALGLLATEVDYAHHSVSAVGQNPLDAALWRAPAAGLFTPDGYERLDLISFDHRRRMTSVLVRHDGAPTMLVSKDAPEHVLRLCGDVPGIRHDCLGRIIRYRGSCDCGCDTPHAGSIATQTLIIFAIRTRRTPFFRSRPSSGLLWASLGVVSIGIYLPLSPLAGVLGFDPLPAPFFLTLLALAVVYLALVEVAKGWFLSRLARHPSRTRRRGAIHHVNRRAARFSSPTPIRR